MRVIHIKNDDSKSENIEKLKSHLSDGGDAFVLIYMNGCGPCEATKPEWFKLKDAEDIDNVVAVDIDKDIADEVSDIIKTDNIVGFPTIRHIKNGKEEDFEKSNTKDKSRTTDAFVQWIKMKTSSKMGGKRRRKSMRTKRHTRKMKGGKWTRKYKKSINCKRPRGFSQKQYCKYGRNKK